MNSRHIFSKQNYVSLSNKEIMFFLITSNFDEKTKTANLLVHLSTLSPSYPVAQNQSIQIIVQSVYDHQCWFAKWEST